MDMITKILPKITHNGNRTLMKKEQVTEQTVKTALKFSLFRSLQEIQSFAGMPHGVNYEAGRP